MAVLDSIPHPIMIVRREGLAPEDPTPGATYSVGQSCGGGVVKYQGTGTFMTDTGLNPGRQYQYGFYTVNNGYYSAGSLANAQTQIAQQQPRGTIFVF